jgi:hypothetical protein
MLRLACQEFFQDLLDLEPGERWEKELYKRIDECDLFVLFWSNAAKRSKWVRKEIEYAHRRKRGKDHSPPRIFPVILGTPPPPKPPPQLAHMYLNDYLIYFRNMET